jgi:hypothetical protein
MGVDKKGKPQYNPDIFNQELAKYNSSLPADQQLTPEQLEDAQKLTKQIIEGQKHTNQTTGRVYEKGNLNGDLAKDLQQEYEDLLKVDSKAKPPSAKQLAAQAKKVEVLKTSLTPEKAIQMFKFQTEIQSTGQLEIGPHPLYRIFVSPDRSQSADALLDNAQSLRESMLRDESVYKDGRNLFNKVFKSEDNQVTHFIPFDVNPETNAIRIKTYMPVHSNEKGQRKYIEAPTLADMDQPGPGFVEPGQSPISTVRAAANTPLPDAPPAEVAADDAADAAVTEELVAGQEALNEVPGGAELKAQEVAMSAAEEQAVANEVLGSMEYAGISTPEQSQQVASAVQAAVQDDSVASPRLVESVAVAAEAEAGAEGATWAARNAGKISKTAKGISKKLGILGVVLTAGTAAFDLGKIIYYTAKGDRDKTKKAWLDLQRHGLEFAAGAVGSMVGSAVGAAAGGAAGTGLGGPAAGLIGTSVGRLTGEIAGAAIGVELADEWWYAMHPELQPGETSPNASKPIGSKPTGPKPPWAYPMG